MKSVAVDPPYFPPAAIPGREDMWSEEVTSTLLDAWAECYINLNRGNLRQKNWQEVAKAVNHRHGFVRNARRTGIQCKNRIDTLKKKYKIEKARFSDSGVYDGTWPFFHRLDSLIGDHFPPKKPSPPSSGIVLRRSNRNNPSMKSPTWVVAPVRRRSNTQKRRRLAPATAPDNNTEDVCFRRNSPASATAVAAVADGESSNRSDKRKRGERKIVEAMEKFGEIYERVETAKQKQMVELEKQRMQFTKDLEIFRMQLLMEMQVQLQKIEPSKSNSSSSSDDF